MCARIIRSKRRNVTNNSSTWLLPVNLTKWTCWFSPPPHSAGMWLMYPSAAHPHHFYGIVQLTKPINPIQLKTFPPLTRMNQRIMPAARLQFGVRTLHSAKLQPHLWNYYALLHALFLVFPPQKYIPFYLCPLPRKMQWQEGLLPKLQLHKVHFIVCL